MTNRRQFRPRGFSRARCTSRMIAASSSALAPLTWLSSASSWPLAHRLGDRFAWPWSGVPSRVRPAMGAAPRDGASRVASAGRGYLHERADPPADTGGRGHVELRAGQPAARGRTGRSRRPRTRRRCWWPSRTPPRPVRSRSRRRRPPQPFGLATSAPAGTAFCTARQSRGSRPEPARTAGATSTNHRSPAACRERAGGANSGAAVKSAGSP